MKKFSLVFYNNKNKYSIKSLLGSIETSTSLIENIDVYIFKKENFINKLKEIIINYEYNIVAFSLLSNQFQEASKIIEKIRRFKKILIIAGGAHPTGAPIKTLLIGVDIVFIGEAEKSFLIFLQKFIKGEDIYTTPQIGFFHRNKFKFNRSNFKIKLNEFPPFSQYFKIFGPIEITRGCPFQCKFCQTSFLFGKQVQHRSIKNILKYVKILKENNLFDIRFISPNSLSYGSTDGIIINIPAIDKLLYNIKKIDSKMRVFFGSFPSEVRPEFLTSEALKILKQYIDNKSIVIGAQTGSERILKLINRGHTIKDVYKGVDIIIKYGFIPEVDFIFGFPFETENDMEKSVKMAEDLSKAGAKIHLHTFIPLPGTPLFKKKFMPIPYKIKIRLEHLISNGKAYGQWKQQEEFRNKNTNLNEVQKLLV